jgi:hypothetical protein
VIATAQPDYNWSYFQGFNIAAGKSRYVSYHQIYTVLKGTSIPEDNIRITTVDVTLL